jgi:hypothetical protein
MLLASLAVLVFAHVLPGLFLVKLLDLGEGREERFLVAAVLGGPLAALLYLVSLVAGSGLVYWIPAALLALAGLLLPFPRKLAPGWPRRSTVALGLVYAAAAAPYLATTGGLYRPDSSGALLLDQALQRDALFHLGVVRSLEVSYPPSLLSVSGAPIGYHAGYHLQLALASRFFGIDPLDGLIRLGPLWSILLYVLSAYALARRFTELEWARVATAVLVFGSGLGFLFHSRPSVDWWSLAFMDWALVSIFLSNPLLPALPLLFVGLCLLHDFSERKKRGALLGAVFALSFLVSIKMFVAAQVLAALAVASVLRPRERDGWVALSALSLVSAPLLLQTFFAASSSNTSVGLRPLEIVRYSMEKLEWSGAVSALANAGRLESFSLVALAALLLWLLGFLGLRILGLGPAFTSLRSPHLLFRMAAAFVWIGFPLSLLLRIAPSESEELSRLESLNDAGWFVTSSGVVLWVFTARALSRFRPALAASAVALLALPATFQHFYYASTLEPDRIGKSRIEAAERAAAISSPDDLWVEPPDRARPSLLAYVSGRPVVYDSYVGYDYMFVGRDEIDYRRHALAQFWASDDPAYVAWFLDRFDVEFVWGEGREVSFALAELLEEAFANEDVELFRVRRDRVSRALDLPIASPGFIPPGGRGMPYFGRGFGRPARRSLGPDSARLYVPLERGRPFVVSLELEPTHSGGELEIEGARAFVEAGAERVTVELSPREARGLAVVELSFQGGEELVVLSASVAEKN